MEREEPVLRVATVNDWVALDVLMKESAAALFPRFYDEQQAASAVRYIPEVDRMLLADGTYFVLETGGEAAACGGWSRRDRLYTGGGDSEGDVGALDPETKDHYTVRRCSSAPIGHAAVSVGRSSRRLARTWPGEKASDSSY